MCRGRAHCEIDCQQDITMQATINLAERAGWKRCYSCHTLVERNNGCRHMTCRCIAECCYICGLRWRTCTCTDAQLENLQQRAVIDIQVEMQLEHMGQVALNRRNNVAARERRAAAEAEELRIALQMVADFERDEAIRHTREAEVQRRRNEEARQRREQDRISAVGERISWLSRQMIGLHGFQRVLLSERHDFEREILRKNRQDALDTLALRHRSETQILHGESQARISKAEHKFQQEYQFRHAEEKKLENQYVNELREYWAGKPEAEDKIREKTGELREDQNKEYRFWDSYRRQQLQASGETEKRRRELLRVKHVREVRAAKERALDDDLVGGRKRRAERKWVQAVLAERREMLTTLELEQYARVV